MQLDENGFQPKDIQLMPAQGIVFHIGKTQARIEIYLVTPDDGPAPAQPGTTAPSTSKRIPSDYRWFKPEPPKTSGS